MWSKEKQRAANRKSYAKHAERRRQDNIEYYNKNKKKIALRKHNYRLNHKELLHIRYNKFYNENREKLSLDRKHNYWKYKARMQAYSKKWRAERMPRIRAMVIAYYSDNKNICNCCGENNIKFLTIDHVNGGGNKHRKQEGITYLAPWLYSNGFPTGFQVLCYNCNMAKARNNNICPHKDHDQQHLLNIPILVTN